MRKRTAYSYGEASYTQRLPFSQRERLVPREKDAFAQRLVREGYEGIGVSERNGTKKRYSPCSDWFPASRLGTHSGRLRLQ